MVIHECWVILNDNRSWGPWNRLQIWEDTSFPVISCCSLLWALSWILVKLGAIEPATGDTVLKGWLGRRLSVANDRTAQPPQEPTFAFAEPIGSPLSGHYLLQPQSCLQTSLLSQIVSILPQRTMESFLIFLSEECSSDMTAFHNADGLCVYTHGDLSPIALEWRALCSQQTAFYQHPCC